MKWLSHVLVGVVAHSSMSVWAQGTSSEEQQLYEIYQQYHSQPTDEVTWNRLLSPLATETYRIQPGDNLWVISEILFGDGNYWPKVWSVNSKITNPHLIEPGNEIKFKLGTGEAEPSFFISEHHSDSTAHLEPTYVLSADSTSKGLSSRAMVPPPGRISKPVLRNLPPSFSNWQQNFNYATEDGVRGVDIVPRPRLNSTNKTLLQSFVKEGPIQFSGEVIEAFEDEDVLVTGQIVYIKIRSGTGAAGDRLLSVIASDPIDVSHLKLNSQNSDKPKGHVIRVTAELELESDLRVKDPEDGYSYFRARIARSLDIVQPGQKLLEGRVKIIDHSRTGRLSDQSVAVIGGNFDSKGFIFSTGNLIYLDKGSAAGLSDGDIIPIQRTKYAGFREKNPLVPFSSYLAGNIQIVDVQSQYSTAIVLSNADSIRPGDGNRRSN